MSWDMASFPALDAPPLRLEPVSVEHAEEMHAVLADPSIYEFLNEDAPPTLQWLREAYARRAKGQSPDGDELWFNWMIRRDDGRLIGYVQATTGWQDTCWIAYVLTTEGRGQGHATRAVAAMIDYLGRSHDVSHFSAAVDRENARSIALLERLDFELAKTGLKEELGLDAGDVLYLRSWTAEPEPRPRPFHISCEQPAPVIYERGNGHIQIMQPMPIPPLIQSPGCLLVERPLAEFLQALDVERVSYRPAVLFDPVSKREIDTHVRLQVGHGFGSRDMDDLPLDGLRMMLLDGRDCFVSPELKAVLQASRFRYLRFSKGMQAYGASA
jgi:[ribosomal protein S5]-alanine N-acetyltransferase